MRLIGLGVILTLGLFAAPLATDAQPPAKVPRIGYLTPTGCPSPTDAGGRAMFLQGLQERGWVAGQNIAIECRNSEEGSEERLRALAAELVGLKVDVIFAVSSTAVRAIRPATRTIPVVALDLETDPVGSGLATSLARPGGNVTGIFLDLPELSGKRLELLRQVVPRLSRVAVLWDPTMDPTPLRATEAAAGSLGLKFQVVQVRSPSDLDANFAAARRERADALVVIQSPMMDTLTHRKKIVDLALQSRLPAVGVFPTFVQAGGLMSCGPNIGQLFKHATSFIDKILRGARPGELPIERPTHFFVGINATTARALGLTIPQALGVRADLVIP
jgi:putative ABC transport system substrate-binding protein